MGISNRDFEALSAYLDGELSGKPLARLEAQLQTNQDLQEALEQLQRTRSVIRSLPKIRAPRNYLLTPEMAGVAKKPPVAFPVLRFASVLATLLLIIVFMGDIFVRPVLIQSGSEAIQFAVPAVEEPAQERMEAEIVESQLPEATFEAEMESPMVEGEVPPPPAAEAMEMPAEEASPAEDSHLSSTATPPVEGLADEFGELTGPEEGLLLKTETLPPALQLSPETGAGFDFGLIVRFTEISLLIIALATGLTAFYIYRRFR